MKQCIGMQINWNGYKKEFSEYSFIHLYLPFPCHLGPSLILMFRAKLSDDFRNCFTLNDETLQNPAEASETLIDSPYKKEI